MNTSKVREELLKIDPTLYLEFTYVKWHTEIKARGSEVYFSFSTTPSGCGTMIFHGYVYTYNWEKLEKLFKVLLPYYVEEGVGTFITTVGESKNGCQEHLKKIGFQSVSRYHNLKHGSNYFQELLIYVHNTN